jgi:hypothetical protein
MRLSSGSRFALSVFSFLLFDLNSDKALTETRQLPRIVASGSLFLGGQVALRTMGWQRTHLGRTTAFPQVDSNKELIKHDESANGK